MTSINHEEDTLGLLSLSPVTKPIPAQSYITPLCKWYVLSGPTLRRSLLPISLFRSCRLPFRLSAFSPLCLFPSKSFRFLSLPPPPRPTFSSSSSKTRNPAAQRSAKNNANSNAHQETTNNSLAIGPTSNELQDPVAKVKICESIWRRSPRCQCRQ